MAESASGIKRDGEVIGLFLLQNAQERAGEAEDAGGRFTRAGCPAGAAARGEREIRAVSQRVAV